MTDQATVQNRSYTEADTKEIARLSLILGREVEHIKRHGYPANVGAYGLRMEEVLQGMVPYRSVFQPIFDELARKEESFARWNFQIPSE